MSVSPSDTMLNHVVTITRHVDCDGEAGSGSGGETYRAALRPIAEKDLAALGFDVSQRRMSVYFRDNASLAQGDRIGYTDADGNARYVRVETWTDQAVMGRLFKAEGPDLAVDE